MTAGDRIKIEGNKISATLNKVLLNQTNYNFAGGNIPISKQTLANYDYLQVEVLQYGANETTILNKTDCFISLHDLEKVCVITIYSERQARMILLKMTFNSTNITLSGIDANPYGTTNAPIETSNNYYIGKIWGIKL